LAAAVWAPLPRPAIAGYEVAARLAMALQPAAHYARGFHATGTCGAFGAATAAGMLLGLDAARIACAPPPQPPAPHARGFPPTGAGGALGPPTAPGILLGLDAAGIACALGIAG